MVPAFIKLLVTRGKHEDLKFELLGIIAAIKLDDQWAKILNESFIELLHNNLATGIVEDDIILETLMLISSIAKSKRSAEILYSKKFPTNIKKTE
jgi:hypothetical protein